MKKGPKSEEKKEKLKKKNQRKIGQKNKVERAKWSEKKIKKNTKNEKKRLKWIKKILEKGKKIVKLNAGRKRGKKSLKKDQK